MSQQRKVAPKKLEILQLTPPASTFHIRRCHKCDGVTECEDHEVKACGRCGKPMAPFYFFNDEEVAPHSDFGLRPERAEGKVRPILGFTAYW